MSEKELLKKINEYIDNNDEYPPDQKERLKIIIMDKLQQQKK